ncbi:hypothetical protein J6590_074699 [Homalodisca vitripennis]|nr:hypothetical protein J6590_074699 [Homalodisca vitripennis]
MCRAHIIISTTWAFFRTAHMDTVGLEDFNIIDRALENTVRFQTDFFFPGVCLSGNYPTYVLLQVCTRGRLVLYVPSSNNIILNCSSCVDEAHEKGAEETQNILDIVQTIRRVLNFKKNVNDVFSLRVTNAISTGVSIFLNCLLSHWRVYGLHKEVQCFESTSPFFASLLQSHIISALIFLAGI